MDAIHKQWNANQKILRQSLEKGADFDNMCPLLLTHHAMVHAGDVGDSDVSFPDSIWDGLPDDLARQIPAKEEHSIVWVFWHLARIEDITMNILVAASPQVIHDKNFAEQFDLSFEDTGNEITLEKMRELNHSMDIDLLKLYRSAVGQRTQSIIKGLTADDLTRKVDPDRIEQLRASGAVVESAYGIIDYWSRRTIAGLLLMPATRHNLIHLNEGERIKKAVLRQS